MPLLYSNSIKVSYLLFDMSCPSISKWKCFAVVSTLSQPCTYHKQALYMADCKASHPTTRLKAAAAPACLYKHATILLPTDADYAIVDTHDYYQPQDPQSNKSVYVPVRILQIFNTPSPVTISEQLLIYQRKGNCELLEEKAYFGRGKGIWKLSQENGAVSYHRKRDP